MEAVAPELPGAKNEIDARGLTILPAVVDVHVHFNEPGRTEWEGAFSGSRALAAGGGAVFFDMPLNSSPCTVDGASFDEKRAALSQSSVADFGLWGGIVPGNRESLPELAERGVIGFKAFLCDSGLPEFPRATNYTLYEGMRVAARYNLPVAVHAEYNSVVGSLARRAVAEGRTSVRDYLESRPVLAEVEAIGRAGLLAREANCKLHLVHASCGSAVRAALEARAMGTDISIETCPHYLFFTGEDMERMGAVLKCAPPLRSAAERDNLWELVAEGDVDVIASDHSPAPAARKHASSFFDVWGGIAGVQSTLSVLLDSNRALPLARIAQLTATTPAARFGLARKGRIEAGCDADLVLIDLNTSYELTVRSLLQRHPLSPYLGKRFRGVVRRTIRGGETIYADGAATASCTGKWIGNRT